jgi:hypothetical protein
MFFSQRERDQVSHPHGTADEVIVLYTLFLVFSDRRETIWNWMVESTFGI